MTSIFFRRAIKPAARRRSICATFVALLAVAACARLLNEPALVAHAQQQQAKTANAAAPTQQLALAPRLVSSFEGYQGPYSNGLRVALVALSPDGRVLALSGAKNSVRLYDTATGKLLYTLKSRHDWINAFTFSPDSRMAATRDGEDRTVRLWDLSDGKELRTLSARGGLDFELSFKTPTLPAEEFFRVPMSNDGKIVLAEKEDDVLVMFDAATGREVGTLDHKTESNSAKAALKLLLRGKQRMLHMQAVYSPDGTLILTANGDNFPKLWDAETGRPVATLDTRGERVYNAAFSPDSRMIATETRKGALLLWDTAGRLVAELGAKEIDYSYFNSAEAYGSPSFVFSPDSKTLATYHDRATQIWDAATGRLIQTLPKPSSHSALFSKDSRVLFTSGGDAASARVWDAATGKLIMSLPKARETTDHVALSPDGRVLLTAGDAGVKLWDAATGELLAALDKARFPMKFSPDGRMLATGGTGKTALLYELAPR